jgi:HPt (histidine-containing phosphotransfer) domain-containing protein
MPVSGPACAQALDTAAGLDRMMGDRGMYLRVLARFRADYTDNVARLRDALDAGDMTLAHRIAHTLKGAAAMIEARGLRALAVELEQLLRDRAAADPQLVDRLDTELACVIAQVDGLLAPPAPTPSPAAEPTLSDCELAQLWALLDLGDSGAQDVIVEKRGALCARLGEARMQQLEAAVAAFDFERALSVLGPRPAERGAAQA